MSTLLNWLLIAVGICGMFLILIAPHEGGHFLAAKLFKVRVIEFSVGAGPKLWSTTRNGTLYALRLLPILGYVRMGGMEAGDFEEANGFHSKHPVKRIAILAAGPIANALVAMLLVTGATMTQLNSEPGKIVAVVNGSTAAQAGLVPGDRIATVDGKPISSPENIRQDELAAAGHPVIVTGTHADGRPFTVQVTPKCADGTCQMGIYSANITTPLSAVHDGIVFPWQAFQLIVRGLGAVVTGHVQGGLLGPQGMTGPIGIAAITADAVNVGPPAYVTLVALFSVVIGVTNLLPLLALDGGRIVVAALEWLRRRPFDRNMELNFQNFGLAALLVVVAIISFLDIQRLITGTFTGIH